MGLSRRFARRRRQPHVAIKNNEQSERSWALRCSALDLTMMQRQREDVQSPAVDPAWGGRWRVKRGAFTCLSFWCWLHALHLHLLLHPGQTNPAHRTRTLCKCNAPVCSRINITRCLAKKRPAGPPLPTPSRCNEDGGDAAPCTGRPADVNRDAAIYPL